jgi:hypothetical protein
VFNLTKADFLLKLLIERALEILFELQVLLEEHEVPSLRHFIPLRLFVTLLIDGSSASPGYSFDWRLTCSP